MDYSLCPAMVSECDQGAAGVWVKPIAMGASYMHVEGYPAYLRGTEDARFIREGKTISTG